MSNFVEYSSKSVAVRGFVRAYGDKLDAAQFVTKAENGKFGFDRDAADAALGIAGMSEEDQAMAFDYGHANCPHCGIHLSNGVGDYDGLVDLHGEAKAYELQKHEWACLGCNGEWGAEIPAPTKRKVANKTGRTYTDRNKSTVEGPVAIVWALADANPGAKRKEIVEAAMAKGVTRNTANTQFQYWRKARGLAKTKA